MNLGEISPLAGGLPLQSPLKEAQWTFMSMFGSSRPKPSQTSNREQEGQPDNDECKGSLRNVIESQIIPRLLQANTSFTASNAQTFNPEIGLIDEQVEVFALLCLQPSAEDVSKFVEQLQHGEVGNDDIFLKLMAPAARCLGVWWEEDKIDFMAVTLGLLRMQQIAHELGYDYHLAPKNVGAVRRVMLASAPGSQHILGLVMVSEFFRKEGWQVVVEIANTEKEILQAAANEWFDLVGLSVGIVEQIPTLEDLITSIKKSSRNPETPVLLGGPAFLNCQVNAQSLGASGISLDALHGIQLASALVDPLKRPAT